jgi:CBS domain containing-hemolysin-like protein
LSTALGLVAVILLILATGYFVAAEFAYVAVRRGAVEARAEAGDPRGRRALQVLKRLSFMLSGAQLGITVTTLAVGYIAEPTIAAALDPLVGALGVGEGARRGVSLAAALVIATVVSMVVGELAPKNLAIAVPETTALRLAASVHAYTRLLSPVIRFFDGAANRLLRRFGIEPIEELHGGVTVEELDLIVEESARGGMLGPGQAELLLRALAFRELDAGSVMRHRGDVVVVSAEATGADLLALLGDPATPHSRFPVTSEGSELDEVVGMIEAKDLVRVPREERAATPLATLMREPLFVPESASLNLVLAAMQRAGTELAIVIDEYGGAAGILTLEDLAEELVGAIDDEHDPHTSPEVVATGPGRWRLSGALRLDEIERETGVELPEGEYDTVGGLIMSELQRIPEVGDAVSWGGVELSVVAMDQLRVDVVELSLGPGAEPSPTGERGSG